MSCTDKQLRDIAYQLRLKALEMVYHAKTGHAAPSMSAAELLAVLYFDTLRLDPEQPKWAERDRFILSKGHACPIYYAALAKRGFFPEDDLLQYRAIGSKLQGHPDMRKCPGVDMTTGSLGNGVSAALGMALAGRKDGGKHRVYVLSGDGELQEGIVWEALMYAGNQKLDNLILMVDRNGLQSGGRVDMIQSLGNLEAKLEAFGWAVQTIDGHSVPAIRQALANANDQKGKPCAILAKTVKGKGISYMEGQYQWHMKAPDDAQYALAVDELRKELMEDA